MWVLAGWGRGGVNNNPTPNDPQGGRRISIDYLSPSVLAQAIGVDAVPDVPRDVGGGLRDLVLLLATLHSRRQSWSASFP